MRWLVLLALVAVAATPEEAGKKVFTGKCARCHKLYDPAGYNDTTWERWMEKMSKKAKLNDEQVAQLSDYLKTLRTKRQE